jgi:mono/diheme cytochrome c family protein
MNRLLLAAITTIKRVIVLSSIIACPGVLAAEDVWKPREIDPLWQSECGSCHMAFPPALLSSGDWQILMQGLDKHFGVNASLDAKSRDQIAAFLDRNAGSRWGHSADSQRITETSFFVKKHKASIRLLIKGRVKSLVDCAACHKENGTENPG